MQTRICTIKDIPALIAISRQSYREHYSYLWFDQGENYIRNHFNEEQFEKELTDTNIAIFLILHTTVPVGLLKLNIDKSFGNYDAASTIELERLYLIKAAAGKGYGKAAINFAAGFAKDKNKKLIWLKTMESSSALDFYVKQGFTVTAETALIYPMIKEEYGKMLVLAKDL